MYTSNAIQLFLMSITVVYKHVVLFNVCYIDSKYIAWITYGTILHGRSLYSKDTQKEEIKQKFNSTFKKRKSSKYLKLCFGVLIHENQSTMLSSIWLM